MRITRCMSVSMSSYRLALVFANKVKQKSRRFYLNKINFCEAVKGSRLLDIQNRNDVLVVEISKELHLTQRSETEHGVIERSNLLDCDLLS